MKVIVAGSRSIRDEELVREAIYDSQFGITELVCGMAAGVDKLAYRWALSNKLPVRKFFPNWRKYGVAAGPLRNEQMAQYADALVAVWDGSSRGTKHMIASMKSLGKPVFVRRVIV